MKQKTCVVYLLLLLLISLTGCNSYTARSVIDHAVAPIVSRIKAYPDQVNPGATIILDIDLTNTPSQELQGGQIIITDSEGNLYQQLISKVKKAIGTTLVSSITLSPLVPSGELLLEVFVLDSQGNASNTGFISITVL